MAETIKVIVHGSLLKIEDSTGEELPTILKIKAV